MIPSVVFRRLFSFLFFVLFLFASAAIAASPQHGLALLGDVKYPQSFTHFDYVNPNAPKGGRIVLEARGTFNSFNPYILTGISAAGMGLMYDSLMAGSADEAASQYGLIAQTVTVADDRSWVRYELRPEAKFSDDKPITAEDVVFSFNTLMTKGAPNFKLQFKGVDKVVALDDRTVEFKLADKTNRELAYITGGIPVLPKHYYDTVDFTKATLQVPVGSGGYKIKTFEPGRRIVYERIKNYWAKNLPVNKGRYNFDQIEYNYYRDFSVIMEAFKAGKLDFRQENISKNWATAYGFPAAKDGRVIVEEVPHQIPNGMQAFVMNLRKPLFQDIRVRKALNLAFDFEWTNEKIFYGAYSRTNSYFPNSELAATDLPSAAELKLLEPYRKTIPREVFESVFKAPVSDGSGFNRYNLLKAQSLLQDAGWQLKKGKLVNAKGEPFKFDILLRDPVFERATLPYVANLKRLGIQVSIRTVDSSQFIKRVEKFDFDMMLEGWGQGLTPGNEQLNYFGCGSANAPGSDNYLGLCNKAVDGLIKKIITAEDRDQLIMATRALDRVLSWGYYVVPHWHLRQFRMAYWDKFGHPTVRPKYSDGVLDTWWVDKTKEAGLMKTKEKK